MASQPLPFDYAQLRDKIDEVAVDSIVVMARSRGWLNMPGRYSAISSPSGFLVRTSATNNDRVETEQRQIGSVEDYSVSYEVINLNDSPAFAWIERS